MDESFIDENKKEQVLQKISIKKNEGVKNNFNIRCKIKK